MTEQPTIPVHISTIDGDDAYFTHWPVNDLDGVVNLIRAWGGVTSSTGESGEVASGEFVVVGGTVVFRVNIEDPS